MNQEPKPGPSERVPDLDQVDHHLELLARELCTLDAWARERAGDLLAVVQDCEAESENEWTASIQKMRRSRAAWELRALIRVLIRAQLGLVHPEDERYRYVSRQLAKQDRYERDDAPWRDAA